MYEKAIEILKLLNDHGFEAYIVGGYPRNTYLRIDSTDIDICTNAKPNDISSLFSNVDMANSSYGSVHFLYGGFLYEITTFRCDKAMLDGNRSYSVEYVNSLKEDLQRRDFIMNTLCMDRNGEYIDYLGAIEDINHKIIRTVKDASISFKEDPLRILRAIRFSTVLSFSLSDEIVSALFSTKDFLSKLSFHRCKSELDLIFSNLNCITGISIMKKFGLDETLSLEMDNVSYSSNYLGIWAQMSFSEDYPFTNQEKRMIDRIRFVLSSIPSFSILYKYGMDVCGIVDEIYENQTYAELNRLIPIHSRDEIAISKEFLLSNVPHHMISTMYQKIEYEILCGNLCNESNEIQRYILENI